MQLCLVFANQVTIMITDALDHQSGYILLFWPNVQTKVLFLMSISVANKQYANISSSPLLLKILDVYKLHDPGMYIHMFNIHIRMSYLYTQLHNNTL